MRYSKDLVERICDELRKIPNIRYVCKKVGIDHSTFYRWMIRHHTFHQAVTDALFFGREGINDAAESVIITGIQNGSVKCATYWLGHNHERYLSVERVPYTEHLTRNMVTLLKSPIPKESIFEELYDYYFRAQKIFNTEDMEKHVYPLMKFIFHGDPELEKIFYATYEEWKENRIEHERKEQAVMPDIPDETP